MLAAETGPGHQIKWLGQLVLDALADQQTQGLGPGQFFPELQPQHRTADSAPVFQGADGVFYKLHMAAGGWAQQPRKSLLTVPAGQVGQVHPPAEGTAAGKEPIQQLFRAHSYSLTLQP